MKNQLSRLLAPAALAGTTLLALAGITGSAFAQTVSTSTNATGSSTSVTAPVPNTPAPQTQPLLGFSPAPVVVNIDNSGNALIRGTVQTVGTSTLTLVSWGGIWTVNTASTAQVYSNQSNSRGNVDAIAVGDFVGVDGTVALAQGATVNAAVVRDWTTNPIGAAPLGMSGPGTATSSPNTVTPVPTPATGTTSGTTVSPSVTAPSTNFTTSSSTGTNTGTSSTTNTEPTTTSPSSGASANTTGTSGSITPSASGTATQTSPGIPVTQSNH